MGALERPHRDEIHFDALAVAGLCEFLNGPFEPALLLSSIGDPQFYGLAAAGYRIKHARGCTGPLALGDLVFIEEVIGARPTKNHEQNDEQLSQCGQSWAVRHSLPTPSAKPKSPASRIQKN